MPCFVQDLDEPKSSRGLLRQENTQREAVLKDVDSIGDFRGGVVPSVHEFDPLAYPAIPLCWIFHPADPSYPYPDAVLAVRAANHVVPSLEQSRIPENDNGLKVELQLESLRRKLKQQQRNGLQEYICSRPVSPKAVGGIFSMLNAFNDMPVEPTSRNTELLYYCKYKSRP